MSNTYYSSVAVLCALVKQFSQSAYNNSSVVVLRALVKQLLPAISSLSPLTTIFPLVFVLLVTCVKDAWDDIVS